MKVLYILPYMPVPPTYGGAMRVFHLIRLAARSNDVTVLAYGRPGQDREMEDLLGERGARLRRIRLVAANWPRRLRRLAQAYALVGPHSFFYMLARSGAMRDAIRTTLEEGDFDIVQTEFAHMGSFPLPTGAHKILDAHNVEYDNFRRMAETSHELLRRVHYRAEFKKFRREEHAACRRYDTVFVTSGRDKAILDADVPEVPKTVVPNGVDASYFAPGGEVPREHHLVFTGSMSYVPNHDGMLWFVKEVFPLILRKLPRAVVTIAGGNPAAELLRRAAPNVVVTGTVPDVRPYVRRASIYVVPLRMGGGTRLKVLEAMAMRKPIVTTSVGCEGIDVRNGESALLADDPQAFADAVVRLAHDAPLCRRLTAAGEEIMRAKYEWSVIGRQVQDFYERLGEPAGAAGQPAKPEAIKQTA